MVVLAASVCTRGGKPIISRQFRELTKDRVTTLLSNFPTLLSNSNQSQHTAVEDEFTRYIYQPLEEFYVVLITNKHSNILQDIDTLHLFTQSITSILRNIDEREIYENCFELLSAFDEIICLGYKENLTSSQIITFLEMDSHEERIQEIIERNKELEAAEASKKKAAELQFKEMMKKSNAPEFDMYSNKNISLNSNYQNSQMTNNVSSSLQSDIDDYSGSSKLSPLQQQQQLRKGGMQLGKKPIQQFQQQQQQQQNQEPLKQFSINNSNAQSRLYQPEPTVRTPEISKPQISNNGILLTLNEKYSAQISREGTITSCEVKGDLQVRINDSSLAYSRIQLEISKNNDKILTQYKTHPNVDKKLFNSSSIIGLKDSTKPFPSNDQNLGVLRWRSVKKSNDDNTDSFGLLPIILTTWVNNNNDGTIGLTFEYENDTTKSIDEILIIIPIINAVIESNDDENVSLEFTDDGINIKLTDLINKSNGSFEILCKDCDDEEALFPMEISFNETKEIESGVNSGLQVNIGNVVNVETEEVLPFDIYMNASSESYYIV